MKSRKIVATLALGACASVAVAGTSIARDPADVEVTIRGAARSTAR